MSARVTWRGKAITAAVVAASKAAIDETTEQAAEAARASHGWSNRTGQLEGEVVSEPAQRVGGETVGKFGSTMRRGFYGLFLERRTPFLRPAADQTFRTLAGRIKRRL
jgi:hypothetical protein